MEKLKAWKWVALIPIPVICLLGLIAMACGQETAAYIIVTTVAIALPTAWSLVAMGIVLTLGEKGRSSARVTYHPIMFFALWIISSMVTGLMLSDFPYVNTHSALPIGLKILDWSNAIIICAVVYTYILQCRADNRD